MTNYGLRITAMLRLLVDDGVPKPTISIVGGRIKCRFSITPLAYVEETGVRLRPP
jgi:hypothetical protein